MIKAEQKITKGDITKIILAFVKTAGVVSAILVAPNVLMAFKKLGIIKMHNRQREVIQRARDTLIRNGYLEKSEKGFLILTERGEEKLRKFELNDYKLIIPKYWDKKWRVLIFDIPEYRGGLRDKIRNTLVSIGFMRLQDSVWVYPYDCAELVSFLKVDFKIGKDLLYMTVDSIENSRELVEYFGLK